MHIVIEFSVTYNNRIITTSDSKYQFDSKDAGSMIFTYLKKYSRRLLQIDAESDEKQFYGEVLEKSIRIALKLTSYGIKPTDTITLCTTNHINSCIPVFASLYIGAIITAFDTKMHLNEASIFMSQIDPKVIFVDPKALNFVQTLLQSSRKSALIIVFGPTSNHINFFDMLSPNIEEIHFTPVTVEETDTALIFFTTGSTGTPKGVCVSHRAFLSRVAAYTECSDLSQRSLIFANWYWSVNISYWGSIIFQGGCRILQPFSEDLQLIWKAIRKYKPTYMFLTPFEVRQLYESKTVEACVNNLGKMIICGSSFCDRELIKYRNMFPNSVVVRGYGLTEAGLLLDFPCSTNKDFKFINEKPKSMGRVLPGICYKVVNIDTGEVLKPNQEGELYVKTTSVFSEYYKKDSNGVFDQYGWLKTGDIVYYDEDYYFYYVDRLKELIKYRSWHVPPRIIQNALLSRDDIIAACVFGIPHELDEEHPFAVIKLKKSCEYNNIAEDICQYTENLFGNNWKLRGVKIVDHLPITPNGKYDIRKIKDQVLDAM